MKSTISQDELEEARVQAKEKDKPCELGSCLFRGLDFSGQDWRYARFTDCTFHDCQMDQAYFQSAVFYQSFFYNCGMKESRFLCSKFVDVQMNDIAGELLRLDAAELTNVMFLNGRLPFSNFRKSLMRRVSFNNCTLNDSRFSQAVFTRLIFNNTNINQIIFNDSMFDRVKFTRNKFQEINIAGAIFENSEIQRDLFLLLEQGAEKRNLSLKDVSSLELELRLGDSTVNLSRFRFL